MNNEKKEIEKFSEDICKACRTRHGCENEYPCDMAEIVAKELYQKNGYRKNKNTAREIFSELREFVKDRKHRFDLECNAAEKTAKSYNKDEYGKEVFTKILHKKDGAWCECDVIESEINNLAQKYGVGVKG